MNRFVDKHNGIVESVLESLDRVIVHGHLTIAGARNLVAWAVKEETRIGQLAAHGGTLRRRIKGYAKAVAEKAGRPYLRPEARERKEDLVRSLIERDKLSSGLVCVLEAQEVSHAICFAGCAAASRVCEGRRLCQVFYFRAVMHGEWQLRGMRNANARRLLWSTPAASPADERRRAAAVTRLFQRLRPPRPLLTPRQHTGYSPHPTTNTPSQPLIRTRHVTLYITAISIRIISRTTHPPEEAPTGFRAVLRARHPNLARRSADT